MTRESSQTPASPPHRAAPPQEPAAASRDGKPQAPVHPAGCVMIVEDDYFIALSMEEALAHAGFVIAGVADTADRAVTMAGDARPDIVLMDIRLGGGTDGIDAAREILRRFEIPSVFVTAHEDPDTRQRGEWEAHPLAWLLKPFRLDELLVTVRTAIALAREGRTRTGQADPDGVAAGLPGRARPA